MRAIVVSATIALASAAAAGELRNEIILVVDDFPSRGTLDASIPLPFLAPEDYDPRALLTEEDLPGPPKALIARLPARSDVRLHNKHDYG